MTSGQFNGLNAIAPICSGDDGLVEDSDEEEAAAVISQRLSK